MTVNNGAWSNADGLSRDQRRSGQTVGVRLLLSPAEAAAALSVSRSKLYRLLKQGRLESVRLDGNRRIPVSSLEALVQGLLLGVTPAVDDKDLRPES
jgi:excisionase family DNA binding protein